jgi:hypothetical protein
VTQQCPLESVSPVAHTPVGCAGATTRRAEEDADASAEAEADGDAGAIAPSVTVTVAVAVAVPEVAATADATVRGATLPAVVTAALSDRPAHTAIVPTAPITTAPTIIGTSEFRLDLSSPSGLGSVAATSARGVKPPLLLPALAARRAFALADSDGGGTEITVPARSTRYVSTASRIEAADA